MPTPDELRKEVKKCMGQVADVLYSFIDEELHRLAADFIADGTISIDLEEIDNDKGCFNLEETIDKEMYNGECEDDCLKPGLINLLVDILREKYGKEGWIIKRDNPEENTIEFKEKGKKKVVTEDDTIARSELLDFEE